MSSPARILFFSWGKYEEILPRTGTRGILSRAYPAALNSSSRDVREGEVAKRAFPEIDDRYPPTGLEVACGISEIGGTVFQMVIGVDRKNEIHLLRNQRVVLHSQNGPHILHLFGDGLLVNTGVHGSSSISMAKTLPVAADGLRQTKGEVTGAGPEVGHFHTGFQLKRFDHSFRRLPV